MFIWVFAKSAKQSHIVSRDFNAAHALCIEFNTCIETWNYKHNINMTPCVANNNDDMRNFLSRRNRTVLNLNGK